MRPLQVLCTKCFTYIPCYIYTNHESQHKQVNLTNFVEKNSLQSTSLNLMTACFVYVKQM